MKAIGVFFCYGYTLFTAFLFLIAFDLHQISWAAATAPIWIPTISFGPIVLFAVILRIARWTFDELSPPTRSR